eukprot:m.277356 g.277356  ORF g.277356 m.277356 type:complete len:366 (+) comp26932_c2_seq2:64-1161(+)
MRASMGPRFWLDLHKMTPTRTPRSYAARVRDDRRSRCVKTGGEFSGGIASCDRSGSSAMVAVVVVGMNTLDVEYRVLCTSDTARCTALHVQSTRPQSLPQLNHWWRFRSKSGCNTESDRHLTWLLADQPDAKRTAARAFAGHRRPAPVLVVDLASDRRGRRGNRHLCEPGDVAELLRHAPDLQGLHLCLLPAKGADHRELAGAAPLQGRFPGVAHPLGRRDHEHGQQPNHAAVEPRPLQHDGDELAAEHGGVGLGRVRARVGRSLCPRELGDLQQPVDGARRNQSRRRQTAAKDRCAVDRRAGPGVRGDARRDGRARRQRLLAVVQCAVHPNHLRVERVPGQSIELVGLRRCPTRPNLCPRRTKG